MVFSPQGSVRLDAPPACDPVSRQGTKTLDLSNVNSVVEHLSGRLGRSSSRDQAVATRPAAEGQRQLPSGRLLFPNRLCLDSP
jgi:hypothetical protein